MYKRIFTIFTVVFSSITIHANDFQTVENSTFELEKVIYDNARKIHTTPAIAKRVNQVLRDTITKLENILLDQSSNPSPNTKVDLQLVNIAQSSCANLSYDSDKARCYKGFLEGAKGVLQIIRTSCLGLNDTTQQSYCFNKALDYLQNTKGSFESMVSTTCSQLSYTSYRTSCFESMLKNSNKETMQIIKAGCSSAKSNQSSSSACYKRAIEAQSNGYSIKEIIKSSCHKMDYVSERSKCYKESIDKADLLGLLKKSHSKGCYIVSDYDSSAKCFYKSLSI